MSKAKRFYAKCGLYPKCIESDDRIIIKTGSIEAHYNFTLADATIIVMNSRENHRPDLLSDEELFKLLNHKMVITFEELMVNDREKERLHGDPFNIYIRDDIFLDLMSVVIADIDTWMDKYEKILDVYLGDCED